MEMRSLKSTIMLALLILLGAGCGTKACGSDEQTVIAIDGSSTVFPLIEAVAEEFQAGNDAKVTIGVSGTGGGFKKFCNEEIAITGASRPIKPTEVDACSESGVEYIELPVAYDGIAVVVNKDNDWVDHLTVEELNKMWAPEGEDNAKKWSDIRAGWPDEDLKLFGPGTDSGTYDYFTKAIVGTEHSSRTDFMPSENDNTIVQGIVGDKYGLGFFGLAYYEENTDKLKVVPIDDGDPSNGAGPIEPNAKTIADTTYQPLARPIFIYINKAEADRDEVAAFIEFFMTEGGALANEVGYIGLPAEAYELAGKRFADRVTGSVFDGGGSKVGVSVEELLKAEGK